MFNNISRFMRVLLLAICLPMAAHAETSNKVVSVVNGVNLSEAELNQEIGIILPMNQSFHGKLSEEKIKKIRMDAMKNLVDSELKAQDADDKALKIPPAVIAEEMNKMSQKFKTKDEFVTAYKASGFTEKSLSKMIERRLLAEKIMLAEVDGKVTITPEKVKKYYADNVSKYSKPEEFRVSQILIKVEPSATPEQRSALRTKADKLLKRINNGERFEEVAMNESDDLSKIKGGDLGYFHSGQAVEEFESALVKMKIGDTSNVVETLYGFHIIRMTDRRAPRQVPFDEIQDKISKDLVASEKKQLMENWMSKLYEKAKITYPGEK